MKMSVDEALRKASRLPPAEAEALYREMLARFPANVRLRQGLDALCRPRIENAPQDALGIVVAHYQRGDLARALDEAMGLLRRFPHCEILNNIAGAICAALGRHDEAVGHYDRAVMLAPDFFEAFNNRGVALNDAGRFEEAVASFDAAIGLHSGYAEAYLNRGIALRRLQRLEEALASGSTAIGLNPACAEAYNARGNALLALSRHRDALADFERAIELKPQFARAFINRGSALLALKSVEEALSSYDRGVELAPREFDAHINRGNALRYLGRLDEAAASYRRALELRPDSILAAAEVRDLHAQMCLWTERAGAADLLGQDMAGDAFPPFYMLGFEDSPERQLLCARNWSASRHGAARGDVPVGRPAGGRIRIGYFSADFHNHATMYLMAGLLEAHDRDRFEIHAFSYGPDVQDEMRRRLLDNVDGFHQVGHLGDAAVAALARDTSIDIAVDLKGHTQDGRLGIFANRAAAVQLSYLGYPGTAGADFIDHIIADAVVIPDEARRHYSEKIACLPHCYQPNDVRREISDRSFSRAELGLPEKGFVFCCFNNNYKISPAEFDIWMRLLAQVEGSCLWLLAGNRWATDNLRREAQARGIAPDRLIFAERMASADHLARHRHADLFLDTFNVNAHTTASDALWTGVPVLTRLGQSFAARVAGSMLHSLGLPELVTETEADYERRALEIAHDPAGLAALRARLAANRLTSPLYDTERYARDIEALYERLLADDTRP